MLPKDDSRIVKHRSRFSRFAHYIRNAFGREHHTAKEPKKTCSSDDLNGDSSDSHGALGKPGEKGYGTRTANRSNSLGNLTERPPSPSPTGLSSISGRFREELAAKLNAGSGFPFGGGPHRFGTPILTTTVVEHNTICSDDTTGSLSPGSPSTAGTRIEEGSELNAVVHPIRDSYLEGALLRINLNRQRRHRSRTNQSGQAECSGSVACASTLDRTVEEDEVDSSERSASLQLSPHYAQLRVDNSSRSVCESIGDDVEKSQKRRTTSKSSMSLSNSSINSMSSDSVSLEPLASQTDSISRSDLHDCTDENILVDNKEEVFTKKSGHLSKMLQRDVVTEHDTSLGNLSSRVTDVKNRRNCSSLLTSGDISQNSVIEEKEKVSKRLRLKAHHHYIHNRPMSMGVDYSTSSTFNCIQPPITHQVPLSIPRKIWEGNRKEAALSSSLKGGLRPYFSESQKPELVPLTKHEPFPVVRLRPVAQQCGSTQDDEPRVKPVSTAAENSANRHSHVFDLVKVFQQGEIT